MRRSDRLVLICLAALAVATPVRAERTVQAPVPTIDAAPTRKLETAVFAGGCYWGVDGVFSHVKGVHLVVSGFAGGPRDRRVDYAAVSGGDTGYAEAVRVTYDPAQVSYGTLLRIFFSVITDPTTLNAQGPDQGTQYRSALFPLNPEQAKAASAYLAQIGKAGLWRDPIVTRVERFTGFQDADSDHQDFMRKYPTHPYIRRWDAPKLAAFKAMFPTLYRQTPSA
ncbi:peptide-methionine (S)-S-oxide reductase MsrA [Sphingobium sp. CR2-8]|uniref:peptide-methionine (S)-S-oxide reductase MsrA n=1 Tax=Sphingobium sp. CR2-8 TaxID=1306534 RepID=UPI002DB72C47|nr:peptide-methionine (S)-S-oxide reductase MsrA [Sphingobium sp. CR2-8]MEC3912082.1 peptide-methionine (S)-S-oxide reductase MsrA [Sphingobium sp. CR2-8]